MGICNDAMLGQIPRFLDARMLRKVPRRSHYYPTCFTNPYRDQSRVGKTGDTECDIDTPVNKFHRPVEQIKPSGHGWVSVHECFEDRAQNRFTRDFGGRQRQVAARRGSIASGIYFRFLQLGQDPTTGDRILLTCLAHSYRPRRPMQQFGTDARPTRRKIIERSLRWDLAAAEVATPSDKVSRHPFDNLRQTGSPGAAGLLPDPRLECVEVLRQNRSASQPGTASPGGRATVRGATPAPKQSCVSQQTVAVEHSKNRTCDDGSRGNE